MVDASFISRGHKAGSDLLSEISTCSENRENVSNGKDEYLKRDLKILLRPCTCVSGNQVEELSVNGHLVPFVDK